jgi:ATP-dependent protease HslVU (ClpYQ) peptidase subunit
VTVICWDGKTLAADKMCADEWVKRYVTKIRRIHDGERIAGASGDADHCRELLAWVENGGAFPDHLRGELRATALVIHRGGAACLYQRSPHPITLEPGPQAIGSGADAAMAAMLCGKTASEAVEIAAQVCRGVGGGVDSLTFEPAKPIDDVAAEPEPEPGPLHHWVEAKSKTQAFIDFLAVKYPELWQRWERDPIAVVTAICGPLPRLDRDDVAAGRFERKIRGPFES